MQWIPLPKLELWHSRQYQTCFPEVFSGLSCSPDPKTEWWEVEASKCSYLTCLLQSKGDMPRLKKRLSPLHGILRDKQYLIRKQFHIKTDHKPLVPILGLKNLDEMSPQIQCLHMCLLRFNFTVSHVLGKRLITANTLLVIQSPCSPAGWSVLYWRGDWFICSTYIGLQRRSLSNTVAILQRRLARQNQSVRHTLTVLADQEWTLGCP